MGACTSSHRKTTLSSSARGRQGSNRLITSQKDLVTSYVPENMNKITKDYKILPAVLGRGAYGEVRKAIHLATNESRAVKIIYKQDCNTEDQQKIFKEINVLRQLDHPNIVKIYEYFHTDKFIFIVMELVSGGELFDKIVEAKSLSERQAAHYAEQIFSAVSYMHSQGYVHRDIKPENVLCEGTMVKLVDFGTSREYDHQKKMKATHGTPYYIAPEVLQHSYDERCDVWSCGVILYILLTGIPPFNGTNDDEILAQVQKGKASFDIPEFKGISDSVIDLLQKMLTLNPKKRPTMQEVLLHRWFKEALVRSDNLINPNAMSNLANFNVKSKMQGAIYFFLVNNMVSKEERNELIKTFKALDTNGDGELSKDEVQAGLKKVNQFVSDEDMNAIMDRIDHNMSKTINYTEFVAAALDKKTLLSDEKINNCFKIFDRDGSGKISLDEFKQMFKGNNIVDDRVWEEMIREIDINNDGAIEFGEFKDLLLKLVD